MSEFFIYDENYIGKCFWAVKRSRVSSAFVYDGGYLARQGSWNIDPALSLIDVTKALQSFTKFATQAGLPQDQTFLFRNSLIRYMT